MAADLGPRDLAPLARAVSDRSADGILVFSSPSLCYGLDNGGGFYGLFVDNTWDFGLIRDVNECRPGGLPHKTQSRFVFLIESAAYGIVLGWRLVYLDIDRGRVHGGGHSF